MKGFAALLTLVAVAVATMAAVSRLSTNVLAVSIVLGIGLGLSIPLTLGVVLLYRSTPRPSQDSVVYEADVAPERRMAQPQVIVVPQYPAPQTPREIQSNWMQTPAPRRYVMVGDGFDGGEV